MAGLAEAVLANELAVQRASVPELRRLLPILKEAERELGADLGGWLKKQSPEDKYDRQRHRALMYQVRGTLDAVERRLSDALADDVEHQADHARQAAQSHLRDMVEAGSAQFEGAIRPLRVDVAGILAEEHETMLARFASSSDAYGARVVADIHSRLALGVIRNETIDQLTSRLLQSTGVTRVLKARGQDAIAGGFAGRVAQSARWQAERIARTELVNAYAESQARSLRDADRDDPGWLKRWDAANDWRTCKMCYLLDKKVARPDGMFPRVGKLSARPHPPLHPCCRCSLVPWREGWSRS